MSKNLPFDKEYEILYNYVRNKLKKEDNDWYSFKKKFEEQGKQGQVGTLNLDNISSDCVYKTSQHLNSLAKHEYQIMKSLKDIGIYPPKDKK